jgi:hypothetical protein
MSKIIAIDNLKKGNWKVIYEDLSSHYADLFIGFTEEEPIATFDGLKFGFRLSLDGETIEEKQYPPKGVTYIQTDQSYIINHRLKFKPETEYTLYLWAENRKTEINYTTTFTTPKPPQPYPSWIWDGENWNAPTPYPEDGKDYEWDEENKEWKLYQENIEE